MNLNTGLPLETERLFLRPLTRNDVNQNYISWWNDPEIQAGFNVLPRNWGRLQALQHIARFNNPHSVHLGVFLAEESHLIGFVSVFLKPGVGLATINLCVGDKQYWGKRISDEMLHSVIRWLFEVCGVFKLKADIHGHNRYSVNLFERLGFKREGALRKEAISVDGGRVDQYLYGLLREEYSTNSLHRL